MSIYIKGVGKPECCDDCWMCGLPDNWSGECKCDITNSIIDDLDEVNDDCPIVESEE